MRVEKQIIQVITTPADITITGATLLSIDEFKKYKKNIPLLEKSWWLRSPGDYGYSLEAAVVYDDGSGYYSIYVNYVKNAIRPALQISNLGDVEVGDKIKFGGEIFTVISPEYALCDTAIGCDVFRKNPVRADANVYEASDVKKFVEEWFANVLKATENVA